MQAQRSLHGGNDEYYTKSMVASELIEYALSVIKCDKPIVFIEPAAGECAFSSYLHIRGESCIAYDINLQGEYARHTVIKCDFLKETIKKQDHRSYVSIGNPPFGFASSKAVKFFNKCAEFSEYIAFIVPRTFQKRSIHNRLEKTFHLIAEQPLADNSFILNGKEHNVPCVFQIWKHELYERKKVTGYLEKYLRLVEPNEADFAMRRVGGKAGQVLEGLNHSKSSTYFFKQIKPGIREFLCNYDFSGTVNKTAGTRSLSKLEIFEAIENHYV